MAVFLSTETSLYKRGVGVGRGGKVEKGPPKSVSPGMGTGIPGGREAIIGPKIRSRSYERDGQGEIGWERGLFFGAATSMAAAVTRIEVGL